jgi:thymidylate synthase (FAD)
LFIDAGAACRRGPCNEGKMTCGRPYPKAAGRD